MTARDLPAADEAVAVVGMAGRFPGAPDLDAFWRNLRDGVESVSVFSRAELARSGVDPVLYDDPRYVPAAAVLADVERFDAAFFGINPREAELLDPQQRLFLECAWEAFEDAGYDPSRLGGAVGVYAGASMSTYLLANLYGQHALRRMVGDYQTMLGNDKDYLATRVSYKLGLRGPSLTVQTACSTSLVAVCLACQALLDEQCDMALAGGVSVRVPQRAGYLAEEGGILSPDGHCRAFDAAACGTIGGNGAGAVVLKRLGDAVASGDTVRAVIRGAALNNDGAAKVGFTAPSLERQAEVVVMAQTLAGVAPETVTYVETHGTGTPLGDAIEVAALTRAFRAGTARAGFCALGSVKTNVGHLDAAAGVAGLIKAVLALEHRQLPPSLNFTRPHPRLELAGSPFYVNAALADWPAGAAPRRAGVSSFGIGGTNAHLVVEEAPAAPAPAAALPWQLLVVSARSAAALEAAGRRLAEHLLCHPAQSLADVAYTCQVGRRPFGHRRALLCRGREAAATALAAGRGAASPAPAQPRPLAFLFPGGGAQYAGMGRELYDQEPVFRAEIDRCLELLAPHLGGQGVELRDLLYPAAAAPPLTRTATALPALFATEYALARLLLSWGLAPQAMLGHSLGEYVAAALAGVLSLPDALALVALRGRLFERLPAGSMVAVPLPEGELAPLLGDELSLAAVNGPALSVVAGPRAAIAALEAALAARRIDSRRLHIDVAAHSPAVEPLLPELARFAATLELAPPRIPYLSNVTGTWIGAAEATDPDYWARHLRHTVRFGAGVAELARAHPDAILLEVGPGRTLSTLARQAAGAAGCVVLPTMRQAQDALSDAACLLETLGSLWVLGGEVDWEALPRGRGERRRRVPLPTYPFERQRYWIDGAGPSRLAAGGDDAATGAGSGPGASAGAVPAAGAAPAPAAAASPRRRADPADWFFVPSWQRTAAPALVRPGGGSPGDAVAGPGRCWLLFADRCGLGARLAALLAEAGHEVVTVEPGERFAAAGPGAWRLDPVRREDYAELLRRLAAAGRSPAVVAHLWSVTGGPGSLPPGAAGADGADEEQRLGFASLLALAQALAERPEAPVRLGVVADGMQAVGEEDLWAPGKATLLGPCRVIPQELPHLSCRSIDIDLAGRGGGGEPARLLLDELGAETWEPGEPVVAYRGRQRWVQSFAPVRLALPGGRSLLRQGGVYLIAGGLGGVGLALAEHLAATVSARLVLVGRRPPPPPAAWAELAGAGDRHARGLLALADAGAEVLALAADVTDREQMAAVLARARERFGAVHGIVHAAGVPAGGTIARKEAAVAAQVLAPKVQGARVLGALAAAAGADFLLLCSSLVSLLGAPGQADHCAANAFLDAFAWAAARGAAAAGPLVVAVNWPAWREIGQAARLEVAEPLARLRRLTLADGLSPAEGVDACGRILRTRLSQVIVSPVPLAALVAEGREFLAAGLSERLDRLGAPRADHPRPPLANPYTAPRSPLEAAIAEVWQQLLGIAPVGVEDDFLALGGHSLLATQVISRLRERLGLQLPLRALFEAPTVAGLARAVGEQLAAEAEPGRLAAALAELEGISEEQAEALAESQEQREARPAAGEPPRPGEAS